jgi:site-specific recombinase XerD
MKRATFNVQFYVKRTKLKRNGNVPLYARIIINGQREEFSIQRDIPEKEWDPAMSRMRGISQRSKIINEYLNHISHQLTEIKIQMEQQKEVITALSVKRKYMGVDTESKTILQIFKEHNENCKALENIDFAPGTVERYNTCFKHVEDFIRFKYKKTDYDINDITPQFIFNFEMYLKAIRHCCHNTTVKYLKNFKKIVRIALSNGWMKSDPFINMKFHLEDVDVAYLDEKELDLLMQKEFEINRLQIIKDIYVFCCFTGLAFIDIKQLSYDDIIEKNGLLWIKKRRQKTKNWSTIPLADPARKIIEKYKAHPSCQAKHLVLPVPSNQKMNAYLKEIADICGIKKTLSTHTARHTFATTVTLLNKVSMEVVSKMLGHSSINMTKRYARVVDDLIFNEMEKVITKY